MDPRPDRPANAPTFPEALRFWTKLGFVSFGGPTGQIALMHAELVERRRWISEGRFLHALNFCMLLPGPEAQQLATYVGWLLHGARGGIAAGTLFILPSVFILLGLSWVYAAHGAVPWIAAAFFGLKPAVMAIVADAVIRIGRRALRSLALVLVAAAAFVGIFFFRVPFPAIVLAAGLLGLLGRWFRRRPFTGVDPPVAASITETVPLLDCEGEPHPRAGPGRALRIIAAWGAIWWVPVLLIGALFGKDSSFFREAVFFSKAAMVTFGGAYAVLPYVAQSAVDRYGWLAPGQMLDGLGLAETTPGPLIMVVQFVGFMGGWRAPGSLPPWAGGVLGALITTWVTFAPCFLWIFLGAPYVERLRRNATLASALSTITAAVVGVVLNLAVWFALHTIFPSEGGINGFAIVVSIVAFVGLFRWRWNVVLVVLGSGLLGLVGYAVTSFWSYLQG